MSKLEITIDFGDCADYISEYDIKEIITEKISKDIKNYFDDNINKYVKNYLYSQMERFADIFMAHNPDLHKEMEESFRQMIKEEKSYSYYMFSAPQTYDRDEMRPGYALMKKVCADESLKNEVIESIKKCIKDKFECMSARQIAIEISDNFYEIIMNMAKDSEK